MRSRLKGIQFSGRHIGTYNNALFLKALLVRSRLKGKGKGQRNGYPAADMGSSFTQYGSHPRSKCCKIISGLARKTLKEVTCVDVTTVLILARLLRLGKFACLLEELLVFTNSDPHRMKISNFSLARLLRLSFHHDLDLSITHMPVLCTYIYSLSHSRSDSSK